MSKIILASGPVIVEDHKVLLNIHGDTDFWKFCGGKVEDFDMNLIESAKREVMEEMGLEIEILDKKPFLLHTTKEKEGVLVDVILVHYLAKRIGEIKPGSDIKQWNWIELSDLEKEHLAPNIMPTLKHFGFIK
jgi:ADP-ribose pyrophosphatase YjhB (NUDIX family)